MWDLVPAVQGQVPMTREDIRHMQKRVFQFTALHQMDDTLLVDVPKCKESFCKMVLEDSTAFAGRTVARGPNAPPAAVAGGEVQVPASAVEGFLDLMFRAKIPRPAADRLLQDIGSR